MMHECMKDELSAIKQVCQFLESKANLNRMSANCMPLQRYSIHL